MSDRYPSSSDAQPENTGEHEWETIELESSDAESLNILQSQLPENRTVLPKAPDPVLPPIKREIRQVTVKPVELNQDVPSLKQTSQPDLSGLANSVNPGKLPGNSIVDPVTGEIPTRTSRRIATGEIDINEVLAHGQNIEAQSLSEQIFTGEIPVFSDSEENQDVNHFRKLAAVKKEQRRRRKKRRLVASIVVLLLLGAIGGAASLAVHELGGIDQILFGGKDYSGSGEGWVNVEIPDGSSGMKIGRILEDHNVVASAEVFAQTCKKNSLAQGIQSGRYRLHKRMSAKSALAALLDPAYKADLQITIPPGFTLEQVKERMIKIGNFPREEVESIFAHPEQLSVKVPTANLEGWLAPDTYTIGQKETPKTLLERMINNQLHQLDAAGVKEKERYRALIVASIVEREVNQERYYPQVTRVIYNRLSTTGETHGLLQMDSTVLYGIRQRGGLPSKEALKQDTPYNTYLHPGLPPTPIGNPSLKAIESAVNPTPGNWMYFVTINLDSGETKFSATLEEHKKNVALLSQWCKANPNKCTK